MFRERVSVMVRICVTIVFGDCDKVSVDRV